MTALRRQYLVQILLQVVLFSSSQTITSVPREGSVTYILMVTRCLEIPSGLLACHSKSLIQMQMTAHFSRNNYELLKCI